MGLSIDCARFHSNQHAYSEVIFKENKTDDVICLHFGVHVYICGHMIPSSERTYLSRYSHASLIYIRSSGEYSQLLFFVTHELDNTRALCSFS